MDIGDAKLKISAEGVKEAEDKLKGLGTSAEDMSKTFKRAGLALVGFAVAITAALAATVAAYAEEEKGVIRLSTAMRNVGLDYEANKEAIEANINALQQKTAIADSEQRDSLASLIRITRDTAEAFDLLQLAMDVAVGTGKDLESATTLLMYALSGNWGMLERYIPAIKEAQTEEEKWLLLRELFAGQAEEYGKSLAGQFALLKANIGDVAESIGEILAPTVKALVGFISSLVEKIKNLPGPLKTLGVVAAIAAVAIAGLGGSMLLLLGYLPSIQAGLAAVKVQLAALSVVTGVTTGALVAAVSAVTALAAALSVGLYYVYKYRFEIAKAIPILGNKVKAEDAYTEALRRNALANLDRMGIQHDSNTTLEEASALAKTHVQALMAQEEAEKALRDAIRDVNKSLLEQDVSALRAAAAKGKLAEAAERMGFSEAEALAMIDKANESLREQDIVAYAAAHEKEGLAKIAEDLGMSERKLKRILDEANASLERQAGISSGLGGGWSLGATVAPMPAFGEGAIVKKPTIGLIAEKGPEIVAPLNPTVIENLVASLPKLQMGGLATKPPASILGEPSNKPVLSLDHVSGGTTVYNIEIKSQAFMGTEAEARQWARVILEYIRQDQRRKGSVTV